MAEQITLAALGFILENLKELILYNSKLISGLDEKVKALVGDLDLMKAFVIEYSKNDTDNAILQQLTNEVRNMVHDAEDVIEEYILTQAKRKGGGLAYKAGHAFDYISGSRQDFLERFEKLSSDAKNFIQGKAALGLKLKTSENAATVGQGRKKKKKVTTSYLPSGKFYGGDFFIHREFHLVSNENTTSVVGYKSETK